MLRFNNGGTERESDDAYHFNTSYVTVQHL